jgi:hypothetical protein
VFFGVSLLTERKGKRKCQLFSVEREKKEKKTEKRHFERKKERRIYIIKKEYNTNTNGQRTFETFRGGGGKG